MAETHSTSVGDSQHLEQVESPLSHSFLRPSHAPPIPKGLPRTHIQPGSLLDEISAVAAAHSDFRNEWDTRPHHRLINMPNSPPSTTTEPSTDEMHYAESDIPLPLPPFPGNSRFEPFGRHRYSHQQLRSKRCVSDEDDEEEEKRPQKRRRHHSTASRVPAELPSLKRHQSHYFSNVDLFQQQDSNFNYLKYAKASDIRTTPSASPHIRVMDLCFDFDPRSQFDRLMLRSAEHHRLLHHLTFELFAGDTLALLYTAESEMQTFIRVLAHSELPQGRVHGVLEINGHKLKPRQFGERVAHVSSSLLPSGLTLSEHLNLYSSLVQPATTAFKRQETIEQLIQGLALAPFRAQLVEKLGRNEVQRLKLASKMLLDTDLLLCENILRDMDVYDAAFIIDFVRDWAQRLKRIVIVAMNPPTPEILTMFGKTAILTCGRMVFMGESGEMSDYFQSIGYSCPPFKNPCDYYVDLVTHDVLTVESARESMARIRTLAEIWTHKDSPLNPPRGNIVSPKVQHAGLIAKIFVLYKLFWCRTLNRPLSICWEVVIAMIMSLLLGWIFFQLPLDRRSGINDRQGFLCSLLLICQLPLTLAGTRTVILDWPLLEHDLAFGAYTRRVYLISKLLFDLPVATISGIAYAVPAYILTNQNPIVESEMSVLLSFVIVVALNYLLARYAAWCFALFAQSVLTGALQYCKLIANSFDSYCISGFTFGLLLLFSGFLIHPEDQLLSNVQAYNPVKVLGADLLRASFLGRSKTSEFMSTTFDFRRPSNRTEIFIDCQKKKILATKLKQIPIYTVAKCLQTTGSEAFKFSGFLPASLDFQHGGWLILSVGLMLSISLIAVVHQQHRTKRNPVTIKTFK
ncbi:ATP-binding cassette sub-family G member 8 [Aphelenchoides besseyi]|nr:ATP-binding cassette sub-family G member 8 [Aphelenchoides besseyi]